MSDKMSHVQFGKQVDKLNALLLNDHAASDEVNLEVTPEPDLFSSPETSIVTFTPDRDKLVEELLLWGWAKGLEQECLDAAPLKDVVYMFKGGATIRLYSRIED